MCYQGCRYELTWGDSAGECSLPNGKKPPIDAMCEINDLHVENAKLRETMRHLYACIEHRSCDRCLYAEEPCDFEHDLRELGIEV